MTFDEFPDFWWLPPVLLFGAALFSGAFLAGAGPKHANLKGLRFHFFMAGLGLLYVGTLMLWYGPVGGRIHSPLESRLFGAFSLGFGFVLTGLAFGKSEELRKAYAKNSRLRHADPDPEEYVSPRDRVLGKEIENE